MKRVAIEGASGYSGMELTRVLARHPGVQLTGLGSSRWEGSTVRERLGLSGPVGELVYRGDLADTAPDLVLCATPAEASVELVPSWVARGAAVIDLSNAYRADDDWVYGLTEFARERLRGARRVANPGCYPTAAQLPLLPLIEAGLLGPGPVIVDAKSGVTGAGRKVDESLLYNELGDNHYPYRVGSHQHVPELERGLGRTVLFTPHLLPTRRGLLASCYVPVADGVTADDLVACLRARYASEPFVQVVTPDRALGIAEVAHTPNCRVATGPTVKGGIARVFGSIDNLLKGAASQAVQNLNLCLGLDETQGLV
ncbi:MAG: N-acetyl-gamma-glutamyl-phosphate reductase [Planctomycetota bacterium]